MPTHVIFVALIYPIVGLFLARMTFGHDVMPLLFPLAAGFALIGPFAAIGLYELSRQREKGVDVSWTHAFGVLRCPSLDGIGFLFAVLVLTISVVSFPLLLDRDVGAMVAMHTSVRAVLRNPLMMAAWGLFVAVTLVIGSLAFFVGLALVLPVLAHSTWHLYRKVVEPDLSPRQDRWP